MQRGIEQEMSRSMTIPNGGGGVTEPLLLIAAAHDDDDGNKNNIINVASSNNLKRFGGVVKYMECLKNHAAAIGGSATDGCGEFMAGGEQGTLEALKCSACNCHRNFHRKKILQSHMQPQPQRIYEHAQQQQLAVLRNEAGEGCRKRLRTKFSQEQKEKMVRFAEKAEWKIQNADDAELRCFFEEIGVKRKVLKVWMHNNKSAHLNLQQKPN